MTYYTMAISYQYNGELVFVVQRWKLRADEEKFDALNEGFLFIVKNCATQAKEVYLIYT